MSILVCWAEKVKKHLLHYRQGTIWPGSTAVANIMCVQLNLSKRPHVLSNHLPLKAIMSDPIKGKEVEIYLY